MSDEGANILKKKIACGVRDEGPVDLLKPVPDTIAISIAPAFSAFYGEKCELSELGESSFSRMAQVLAPYDEKSAIYHFRLNNEEDILLIMDLKAAMIGAGWSLAGSRTLPEPTPEVVSPIDRRLAKPLAVSLAEMLFEKAAQAGVAPGSVELIATGSDPRRFELLRDEQRAAVFTLGAKTIEGEELGGVTFIMSDNIVTTVRDHNRAEEAAAAEKWKQGLLRLASWSIVELRAVLAVQDIDLNRLMSMKPGEIIDLQNATIDEVGFSPAHPTASRLAMVGALGNRDGARALKLTSITR